MEKKEVNKPKDLIDASVYLEMAFNGVEGEICKFYLDDVGYKGREIGVIHFHSLGEKYWGGLIKPTLDGLDWDIVADALKLLNQTIHKQIEDGKVEILTHKKEDNDYIDAIKDIDWRISEHDAFLISIALRRKCNRVVTIDTVLLCNPVRQAIQKEYGLRIMHPEEIMAEKETRKNDEKLKQN